MTEELRNKAELTDGYGYENKSRQQLQSIFTT